MTTHSNDTDESCTIYSSTPKDLKLLGNKLNQGELVIVPTETVYGIAGSLFDKNAIENIYRIKKRPITNPLIVHCLGYYDALSLIKLNELENSIFSSLIKKFSPGPITYLVKSSDIIPSYINNNSGYIAIRFPKNKVFRDLIQYAGVPLCAPSANLSNKTSSTCLEHVYKYFEHKPINIINDNNYICEHGIESTIIKIKDNILTVMRSGAILNEDLKTFIESYNKTNKIIILKDSLNETICPGQFKLHYSPEKPVYILKLIHFNSSQLEFPIDLKKITHKYLESIILIDFNSLGFKYKDKFLGYVDLSKSGDIKEAMFNLYNVFHQTNTIECSRILIYDFSFFKNTESIWDKIVKASEGKILSIPLELMN